MTDEERRAKNAEQQRKYRESQRNNPEYWERRHEYSKKYRKSHPEKVKAQKAAAYAKQKREQGKDKFTPLEKPKQEKTKEPSEKKSKESDISTLSVDAPPVWAAPAITVVISEAHKEHGHCIIETKKTRQSFRTYYRMKIVATATSMAELKDLAHKVGFSRFLDTPVTIKEVQQKNDQQHTDGRQKQ